MRPSSRDDAILPQASFRCRQIVMAGRPAAAGKSLEVRFRQKIRRKEGQERERPPTSRSTSFQHDRAPQGGNHDQRRPEGRGREWPVPNFFTTESAKPYSRK